MRIVAAIGRALIGAVFGAFCFLALLPLFVGLFAASSPSLIGTLFWVFAAIGAVSGIAALSARRACGLGFLELGLSTLILPLSIAMFTGTISGTVAAAAANDPGFATLRDVLESRVLTWTAAIAGIGFAGMFFVLAYFLLRRDRATAPIPAANIDASRWSPDDREAYERQQARRS